jgi:serine/threonine-protein kinase
MVVATRRKPARRKRGDRKADPTRLVTIPRNPEESRDLLQQRLKLTSRAIFLLAVAFWVIQNAVALPRPDFELSDAFREGNTLYLAGIAMMGVLWFGTARGPLVGTHLLILDAMSLPLTVSVLSVGMMLAPEVRIDVRTAPHLAAALVALAAMMFRAAMIPSPLRWTFAVSTAMALPILVIAIFANAPGEPLLRVSFVMIWMVLGIIISGVISHAIYGLRAAARHALRIGHYRLRRRIGGGGMGEVYIAEHALLKRPTAIKLILPDRVTPAYVARFEREAQLTAKLCHPNTVTVYDYGRTSDGLLYIAMEYLLGIDLEQVISNWGPQPPGRVVTLLAQVCGSLAEAHGIGLIHRDIKPGNLMLVHRVGQGELLKVLDFGLATSTRDDGIDISHAQTLVGTPLYVAPESIRGEKVDGRSDLYSLGAVGYFLLTGRPPFDRNTLEEVCEGHLNDPVVPPSVLRGEPLPADLEQLVMSCLAKKPDERPPSALAMRTRLLACKAPKWTRDDISSFWASAADVVAEGAQDHLELISEPLAIMRAAR